MADREGGVEELALAEWKGHEVGDKLLALYGHNWKELNFVEHQDGWLICTLCSKKLAGPWHVLCHLESKKHQSWLKWVATTPDAIEQIEAWKAWKAQEAIKKSEPEPLPLDLPVTELPTPARSSKDWLAPSEEHRQPSSRTAEMPKEWLTPKDTHRELHSRIEVAEALPKEASTRGSRMRGWCMDDEDLPPVVTVDFEDKDDTRSKQPPPPPCRANDEEEGPPPPSASSQSTATATTAASTQQSVPPRTTTESVGDSAAASSSDPFTDHLAGPGSTCMSMAGQATEHDVRSEICLRCHQSYDAQEISEMGSLEYGYLALEEQDLVYQLSEASSGHSVNRFPTYAWGQALRTRKEGWFPLDVTTPLLNC